MPGDALAARLSCKEGMRAALPNSPVGVEGVHEAGRVVLVVSDDDGAVAGVGSPEMESGIISMPMCFLRTELLLRSFEGARSLEGDCRSRTGEREIG